MGHVDIHYLLMWGAIISLVVLAARTGMCINRFFIHRAHRRALAELHSRLHQRLTPGGTPSGMRLNPRIDIDD